jgi:integrase
MASLIRPKRKQYPDYWVIQESAGGKRRYHTLGHMSREEAEEQLRIFEARKQLGHQPEDSPEVGGLPLDLVIADIYLPLLGRKAASTQQIELRCLGHVRRHWRGISLGQINQARIEDFKTRRLEEGARTRTVNMELSALRNVLKAAEVHGFLPHGVPAIKSLRITDARPSVFLTLPQAQRLQETLLRITRRGGHRYPSAIAILLGLHTGMRKGEILTREVEDIDWSMGQHGTIRVAGKASIGWSVKTGHERMVPMTDHLASELRRFLTWRGDDPGWLFQRGAQGYLYRVADEARKLTVTKPMSVQEIASKVSHLQHLCNRDEPWRYTVAHAIQRHRSMFTDPGHGIWRGRENYRPTPPRRMQNFANMLKAACREADVPVVHPHALRHSWATLAFSAGMDVRAVQELGGWRSPDMPLRIYAHVSTEHALLAMERFPLGTDQSPLPE